MTNHTTLCACGCGQPVPTPKYPSWQRKFISGHQPAATRPLAERFWEKVDKRGPNDCWEWQGALDRKGYGEIKSGIGRKIERTHRVAWFLKHGEYPDDMLCHTCDNPPCCNPAHLFRGTHQDNHADMVRKGRHPHADTHPHARLSRAQISDIRARYAAGGILQRELAAEYGVTAKHIGAVINVKKRRHG